MKALSEVLRMRPSGPPVHPPLPDFVITAFDAVPRITERYFFWACESKIESATGDCQRTLKDVFRKAGIPDGHATSSATRSLKTCYRQEY